ncbi:MAG TPA: SPASM domain-containing protein, partial [Polyangiaceae bacterium]
FLKVELSRHCKVNCLYCRPEKAEQFFPLEEFSRLLELLKRHLLMVQLYEVGEPLHHPAILECIRVAHAAGVATVISTSLSFEKDEAFWRELPRTGLDLLIVAIDGVAKETYQKYRRDGDLDLVMRNLSSVLRYRRETGAAMKIEWQMIDLPWNRSEQLAARQLSVELGCDRFRVIREAISARCEYGQRRVTRQRCCIWPYVLFLVDAYGNVVPCFKPDCRPGVVGQLHAETYAEIWNGTNMRQLRGFESLAKREGCSTCQE